MRAFSRGPVRIIVSIIFAVLFTRLSGQSFDLKNIQGVKAKDIAAITENNEVRGYYVFCELDRASKTDNIYSLTILDVNLAMKYVIELQKPKDVRLTSKAYNGERFCFSFLSEKEKTMEYVFYDKAGTLVGSSITKLTNSQLFFYQYSTDEQDLLPVSNLGFVKQGYTKEAKYKREFEFLDNAGASKWIATSGNTAKKAVEGSLPLYADKDVVINQLSTRKSLISGPIVNEIICYGTNSGAEIFRINTDSLKHPLVVDGIKRKEDGSILVYGQYQPFSGWYTILLDAKGKIKSEKYVPWDDQQIIHLLPEDHVAKFKERKKIIHDLVKVGSRVFLVTEEVEPVAGGLVVHNSNVERGGLFSGFDMFDFTLFELDTLNNPIKAEVFEKGKTTANAVAMFHLDQLTQYMRYYKFFDYKFTSVSSNKEMFDVVYVEQSGKEAAPDYTVGNLVYTKEKKLVSDKFSITSHPTYFEVLPAKPGYIMFFEYFKKERKVVLRLEKLNI